MLSSSFFRFQFDHGACPASLNLWGTRSRIIQSVKRWPAGEYSGPWIGTRGES